MKIKLWRSLKWGNQLLLIESGLVIILLINMYYKSVNYRSRVIFEKILWNNVKSQKKFYCVKLDLKEQIFIKSKSKKELSKINLQNTYVSGNFGSHSNPFHLWTDKTH